MGDVLVLLSGGQDSTTCLWHAKNAHERHGREVHAVAFDYGQRHRVELDLAKRNADHADVASFTVLPVEALNLLGQTSLTNDSIANVGEGAAVNAYAAKRGLPPSLVPGRNALFLTLAAALAAKLDAPTIITGVCQQDYAGYPDCRESFVDAQQAALREALDWPELCIDAPLLHLSKADTWQMAADLGVLSTIVLHTHTCYEGDRSGAPKPWGYGCGACGACVERERGFMEFIERRGLSPRGPKP